MAGELGTWHLGSVWQLGVNEKQGGGLLARTMIKNFGFPVIVWQDEENGQSNLSLGDRLRFSLFRLRKGKKPEETIDLSQTSFLKKTQFIDGTWGWRIWGEMPSDVAALFPEDELLSRSIKAKIVNFSGKTTLGESIGQVLEIIGIKVGSIQKEEVRDFDCALLGKDNQLVQRLNLIFDCKDEAKEPLEAGFAVSLEIGRRFGQRF